ncbi:phage portal protein [Streptomyces sp. NPDC049887]|uniref:phage portal protein n=1 Tax=Streptomyces sp. NPDC049887 TaxID=3155654 RepID=UPI003441EC36
MLAALRRTWLRVIESRAITALPWVAGGPRPSQISATNATSLIPLFACWRTLADSIASLPVQTFMRNGPTREPNAFLPDLLFKPATRDNLFQWLHKCVISLCARGNAYGLITARNAFALPTRIEWLNPDDVWVDESSPVLPIYYYRGQEVPREDIFHIPWVVEPGRVVGLSPIQAFARTIGVGLAATDYGASWFENGGTPPATMRNNAKTINPQESKEIQSRLSAAMRSRKPLVFGSDWDFTALQVNPEESQFIETMRLTATQVAAIYGVPPGKVGGEAGGSMTYSTVEMESLDLVGITLRPWLVRIESAISDVLPSREYMRFNADAMIRTDTLTRYQAYGMALEQGWLNLDDIRALENKSPLPNGAGQAYRLPGGSTQPGQDQDQDQDARSAEATAFLQMLMAERRATRNA